ncbi:MAG: C45 family autoproteolytic acyltransferase/hydrolase [Microlunatus sp.]|nr:C45 family autoproteolytic acyltransferase/hydrolase [Microlunatus sp.]MDN5771724.1 C45 family autoproteolytic acyltransferase/hydrolase [Microlunatus sp.]
MTNYPLTLYGIRELTPGSRWRALYEATWPAYRAWYLNQGRAARPSLRTAASKLAQHMPELLPTWAKLAEQTCYDDLAATMLTQWDVPVFAPAACSQVTTVHPDPALLRNYDYRPDLFEQVSISTDYLQPVIGTGDCLWGLLDGMNAAGLAISLAFGGERTSREGFAIPLVVRYLLETCQTVTESQTALSRLPVAMAYNLTMIDRAGTVRTAHLSPGHPAEFSAQPAATNHRWQQPLDPEHATRYRSVERLTCLTDLVDERATADTLADRLVAPPLHVSDYTGGFGTLYTADYRPAERTVTYLWPTTSWVRTFDSAEDTVDVMLRDA